MAIRSENPARVQIAIVSLSIAVGYDTNHGIFTEKGTCYLLSKR